MTCITPARPWKAPVNGSYCTSRHCTHPACPSQQNGGSCSSSSSCSCLEAASTWGGRSREEGVAPPLQLYDLTKLPSTGEPVWTLILRQDGGSVHKIRHRFFLLFSIFIFSPTCYIIVFILPFPHFVSGIYLLRCHLYGLLLLLSPRLTYSLFLFKVN